MLIVSALIIMGVSSYFTSALVNEFAREERSKIELWAATLQKKAKSLSYANNLFQELSEEEERKVELWAQASESLFNASQQENVEFGLALSVINNNYTIPIISVTEDGEINAYRNIEGVVEVPFDETAEEKSRLKASNDSIVALKLEELKETGKKIQIHYFNDEFIYLYYSNSRLFNEIKSTFQDLYDEFVSEVIDNAASVPVLMITGNDSVVASNNLPNYYNGSRSSIEKVKAEMSAVNQPISVDIGGDENYTIYYSRSALLIKLQYAPFVQAFIVALFVLIGYWLFSIFRNSEQNQVWVGMSKETAHQLGTPLSSLMGWNMLLKENPETQHIAEEMEKDVHRLEMITDRFSKIGAKPVLKESNINATVKGFMDYLEKRTSNKVAFNFTATEDPIIAKINVPLFEWVIENLSKNAIDAMNGKGELSVEVSQLENEVFIDITDTGKGIPKNKRSTVFQPGYTSKKRGWGLGLSLVKRIVENYHRGKIFVKWSEVDKGTTFRIILHA